MGFPAQVPAFSGQTSTSSQSPWLKSLPHPVVHLDNLNGNQWLQTQDKNHHRKTSGWWHCCRFLFLCIPASYFTDVSIDEASQNRGLVFFWRYWYRQTWQSLQARLGTVNDLVQVQGMTLREKLLSAYLQRPETRRQLFPLQFRLQGRSSRGCL